MKVQRTHTKKNKSIGASAKLKGMQAWYGLEWAIRWILKPIAIAMGEKANEIDSPCPCHECG